MQSGRSAAYVPPSELQTAARSYNYPTDQQQQQQPNSPRSSNPYHSESPPIRLPPEPSHHYRGQIVDNSGAQGSYRQTSGESGPGYRQDNSQAYKQYVESSTRSSGHAYPGDSQTRNSPVYASPGRSSDAPPNCRNSPTVYLNRNSLPGATITSTIPQNDRSYHHSENRCDFPARNSPIYSSNRSDQMRLGPGTQNERNYHPEGSETSANRNSPALYMPGRDHAYAGRNEQSRNSGSLQHNNGTRNSPKTSPTHGPISPDAMPQNVGVTARQVPTSFVAAATGSPVRGQVQAPVTSAATSASDDFSRNGPRITSLPPGVTSGVAGPVFLNAGVPVLQRAVEPEIDLRRSASPSVKTVPGKGLLPYNVTPPRPSVTPTLSICVHNSRSKY